MLHFEELEGNEKKLKGKECSYIQKKLASRTNKKQVNLREYLLLRAI